MQKQTGLEPRIMRPGWAGELGDDEFAALVYRLRNGPRLRRKWGLATAFTRPGWEKRVRVVAMWGSEINAGYNERLARDAKAPIRPVTVTAARQLPMRIGAGR